MNIHQPMDGRYHQIIYFFDQILEAEKIKDAPGVQGHMHAVCIATKPFLAKRRILTPLVAGMKDRFGWKKFGQPVEVSSISHNLQAFLHPKCCKISSINSNSLQVDFFHLVPVVFT